MSVRELLATTSSRELSEWRAYEEVTGPVDDSWRDEMLAQCHELLQGIRYAIVAGNTDQKNKHTIAQLQPEQAPRPWIIGGEE